ncbi:MAG: GNAT family N-acetyltransferase [Sphingomonadales bacterium]|nr:GNAT family N-acetyltransferase [Sphingomonadales bacterium]
MWVKGEYLVKLERITGHAAKALGRDAQPSLFDRLDWFTLLHRLCAPHSKPLAVHTRSEKSDCWLFLAHQANDRLVSLSNWYSFAWRPVFTGEPSEEARLAMLVGAAKRLRSRAASIVLEAVPEEDGSAALVARAFRRAGWTVFVQPHVANHYLDTAGMDFASYWAARPGALKSTVKRKAKKNIVTLQLFDHFDADGWAAYERVYADSWKPEEGQPEFLRALAEREGAAGALRLGVAWIGDRPVAAQFWTTDNGIANIHKLAHVEDSDKASPGTLLSYAMFEHAFERDHVTRIDFGTGDDGYKRDWMNARAMLHYVEMYNLRRPSSWLPALKTALSQLVKRRK